MAKKDFTKNSKKDYVVNHINSIKFKNPSNILRYNLILFQLIFLLLPVKIISYYYINLKVNQVGRTQILSSNYDNYPSSVYIDGSLTDLYNNRYVYIYSTSSKIQLRYETKIANFYEMFYNLKTITYVYMYDIFDKNSIMDYMFEYCSNLETFDYDISYSSDYSIKSMKNMFYSCQSLKSFSFGNLFRNNNNQEVDISYMFSYCKNLSTIDNGATTNKYISDMKEIFYECNSLKSVDLNKFIIKNTKIDLSNFFYNCYKLETFSFSSFSVSNIYNMFYNCNSLQKIDLRNLNIVSNTDIDLSRFCYNCNKLTTFEINFENFIVSGLKEMFYNCSVLSSVNLRNIRIPSTKNIDLSNSENNCI